MRILSRFGVLVLVLVGCGSRAAAPPAAVPVATTPEPEPDAAPIAAPPVEPEPAPPVIVKTTTITIIDKIQFARHSTLLTADAKATLDALAATLLANPDITQLEVQAHRDGREKAYTIKRAEVVIAYLVAKGVEAERLVARNYEDKQPVSASSTEQWPPNARVEFLVLPNP